MSTLQQQHGTLWETYIRKECKDLTSIGQAFVDKNWEAPRVPGKKIPREASKPDFSGFLSGGQHVVFEAKATMSKTSFPFSQITRGQAAHFDIAEKSGAIAFVYVLDGMRRKWVLPWSVVSEISENRASYPFDPESPNLKIKGETWLDTLKRLGEVEG